jgi:hypothetical protein
MKLYLIGTGMVVLGGVGAVILGCLQASIVFIILLGLVAVAGFVFQMLASYKMRPSTWTK